tara:strand:+ start:1689 stop:2036 length:348 start_codon:yes stop_codon:yes gene_type:complete
MCGIIAFFIASKVEDDDLKVIPYLFYVFDNLFSEGITWLALLFITGFITVIELAHRAGKTLIYNDDDLKTEQVEQENKYREESSKETTRSINDTNGSVNSGCEITEVTGGFPVER